MTRRAMDLVAAVQPILEQLDRLPPEERAKTAHEMWSQVLAIQARLAVARRSGVRQLRASGLTLSAIASILDVSITRVKQIETGLDTSTRRRAKEVTNNNAAG